MYIQSIVKSRPDGYNAKTADPKERTLKLNEHFTLGMFANICRSLFEKEMKIYIMELNKTQVNFCSGLLEYFWQ